jgi:hypothetical protein
MRRRALQRLGHLAAGASARSAPASTGSIHTGASSSAAEAAVKYAEEHRGDEPSTSGRVYGESFYSRADLRRNEFDPQAPRAGAQRAPGPPRAAWDPSQQPAGWEGSAEQLAARMLPSRPEGAAGDEMEYVLGAAENERQISYPRDVDRSFKAYVEELRRVQHPGVGDNIPWQNLQELYER